MKILLKAFCGIVVMFSMSLNMHAQRLNARYQAYIKEYSELAVDQMKRHKIPASITLAQGLLESGAGMSTLARKSNNHFGIKCGGGWRGRSVRHDDDARHECFRAYRHAKESYEDHSKFLVNGPRYAFLFQLKVTDYKGWARGLKKAGYATDPSYAKRLIRIIEDYRLDRFDKKGAYSKRQLRRHPWLLNPHQIYIANELAYVVVRAGDTFDLLSDELDISKRRLHSYNELLDDYQLVEGDIIYLKTKHRKAVDKYKYHVVRAGDSMYSIAQKYGMRLKYLYKLNKKTKDYSPVVGDSLRLR